MNKLLQNKFYRFEIMTNKTTYFLCQIKFFWLIQNKKLNESCTNINIFC